MRPASAGAAPAAGRALAIALLASAALFGWWAPPAQSAAASGLLVIPHPASPTGLSYFKLKARPRQLEQAGAIEVRNPTPRSLRVVLAAVNGETLSTLGSSYGRPGAPSHGSTRWLRLSKRSVTLRPGQSTLVAVSVTAPAGSKPGDYLAGVSVEALNQPVRRAARSAISIASVVRYAIGVETTLPGARHPRIRFTGASVQHQPAGLTFLLDANNSGNVILQGVHGWVHITRAGRTVVSRPIEAGTFVAGTSIAYPVTDYRQTPAAGTRYAITAWLRYRGGIARLNTAVSFGRPQAALQQQYGGPPVGASGTAWWKIALLAGGALYCLVITTLLLRRRSRPTSSA